MKLEIQTRRHPNYIGHKLEKIELLLWGNYEIK